MHRRKEPGVGYKAKISAPEMDKVPSEHFFWGKVMALKWSP